MKTISWPTENTNLNTEGCRCCWCREELHQMKSLAFSHLGAAGMVVTAEASLSLSEVVEIPAGFNVDPKSIDIEEIILPLGIFLCFFLFFFLWCPTLRDVFASSAPCLKSKLHHHAASNSGWTHWRNMGIWKDAQTQGCWRNAAQKPISIETLSGAGCRFVLLLKTPQRSQTTLAPFVLSNPFDRVHDMTSSLLPPYLSITS